MKNIRESNIDLFKLHLSQNDRVGAWLKFNDIIMNNNNNSYNNNNNININNTNTNTTTTTTTTNTRLTRNDYVKLLNLISNHQLSSLILIMNYIKKYNSNFIDLNLYEVFLKNLCKNSPGHTTTGHTTTGHTTTGHTTTGHSTMSHSTTSHINSSLNSSHMNSSHMNIKNSTNSTNSSHLNSTNSTNSSIPFKEISDCLDEMKSLKINPKLSTFNIILKMYGQKSINDLFSFLSLMKNNNLFLNSNNINNDNNTNNTNINTNINANINTNINTNDNDQRDKMNHLIATHNIILQSFVLHKDYTGALNYWNLLKSNRINHLLGTSTINDTTTTTNNDITSITPTNTTTNNNDIASLTTFF